MLNSTDAIRAANSESPTKPAPLRHRPEIQWRMHVGGAQVVRDGEQAGLGGLHVAAPRRVMTPAGQTGRATAPVRNSVVLLVVFRAAQPGDGRQQQRRGQQYGQDRSSAHGCFTDH